MRNEEPDLTDAMAYLKAVKDAYAGDAAVYDSFLELMRDYKQGRIDAGSVLRAVGGLFKQRPALVDGFNAFLPRQFRVSDDHRVVAPLSGHSSGGGDYPRGDCHRAFDDKKLVDGVGRIFDRRVLEPRVDNSVDNCDRFGRPLFEKNSDRSRFEKGRERAGFFGRNHERMRHDRDPYDIKGNRKDFENILDHKVDRNIERISYSINPLDRELDRNTLDRQFEIRADRSNMDRQSHRNTSIRSTDKNYYVKEREKSTLDMHVDRIREKNSDRVSSDNDRDKGVPEKVTDYKMSLDIHRNSTKGDKSLSGPFSQGRDIDRGNQKEREDLFYDKYKSLSREFISKSKDHRTGKNTFFEDNTRSGNNFSREILVPRVFDSHYDKFKVLDNNRRVDFHKSDRRNACEKDEDFHAMRVPGNEKRPRFDRDYSNERDYSHERDFFRDSEINRKLYHSRDSLKNREFGRVSKFLKNSDREYPEERNIKRDNEYFEDKDYREDRDALKDGRYLKDRNSLEDVEYLKKNDSFEDRDIPKDIDYLKSRDRLKDADYLKERNLLRDLNYKYERGLSREGEYHQNSRRYKDRDVYDVPSKYISEEMAKYSKESEPFRDDSKHERGYLDRKSYFQNPPYRKDSAYRLSEKEFFQNRLSAEKEFTENTKNRFSVDKNKNIHDSFKYNQDIYYKKSKNIKDGFEETHYDETTADLRFSEKVIKDTHSRHTSDVPSGLKSAKNSGSPLPYHIMKKIGSHQNEENIDPTNNDLKDFRNNSYKSITDSNGIQPETHKESSNTDKDSTISNKAFRNTNKQAENEENDLDQPSIEYKSKVDGFSLRNEEHVSSNIENRHSKNESLFKEDQPLSKDENSIIKDNDPLPGYEESIVKDDESPNRERNYIHKDIDILTRKKEQPPFQEDDSLPRKKNTVLKAGDTLSRDNKSLFRDIESAYGLKGSPTCQTLLLDANEKFSNKIKDSSHPPEDSHTDKGDDSISHQTQTFSNILPSHSVVDAPLIKFVMSENDRSKLSSELSYQHPKDSQPEKRTNKKETLKGDICGQEVFSENNVLNSKGEFSKSSEGKNFIENDDNPKVNSQILNSSNIHPGTKSSNGVFSFQGDKLEGTKLDDNDLNEIIIGGNSLSRHPLMSENSRTELFRKCTNYDVSNFESGSSQREGFFKYDIDRKDSLKQPLENEYSKDRFNKYNKGHVREELSDIYQREYPSGLSRKNSRERFAEYSRNYSKDISRVKCKEYSKDYHGNVSRNCSKDIYREKLHDFLPRHTSFQDSSGRMSRKDNNIIEADLRKYSAKIFSDSREHLERKLSDRKHLNAKHVECFYPDNKRSDRVYHDRAHPESIYLNRKSTGESYPDRRHSDKSYPDPSHLDTHYTNDRGAGNHPPNENPPQVSKQQKAFNFVQRVKNRLSKDPQAYKHFIEILQQYQKCPGSPGKILAQLRGILFGHDDLLNEFVNFVPHSFDKRGSSRSESGHMNRPSHDISQNMPSGLSKLESTETPSHEMRSDNLDLKRETTSPHKDDLVDNQSVLMKDDPLGRSSPKRDFVTSDSQTIPPIVRRVIDSLSPESSLAFLRCFDMYNNLFLSLKDLFCFLDPILKSELISEFRSYVGYKDFYGIKPFMIKSLASYPKMSVSKRDSLFDQGLSIFFIMYDKLHSELTRDMVIDGFKNKHVLSEYLINSGCFRRSVFGEDASKRCISGKSLQIGGENQKDSSIHSSRNLKDLSSKYYSQADNEIEKNSSIYSPVTLTSTSNTLIPHNVLNTRISERLNFLENLLKTINRFQFTRIDIPTSVSSYFMKSGSSFNWLNSPQKTYKLLLTLLECFSKFPNLVDKSDNISDVYRLCLNEKEGSKTDRLSIIKDGNHGENGSTTTSAQDYDDKANFKGCCQMNTATDMENTTDQHVIYDENKTELIESIQSIGDKIFKDVLFQCSQVLHRNTFECSLPLIDRVFFQSTLIILIITDEPLCSILNCLNELGPLLGFDLVYEIIVQAIYEVSHNMRRCGGECNIRCAIGNTTEKEVVPEISTPSSIHQKPEIETTNDSVLETIIDSQEASKNYFNTEPQAGLTIESNNGSNVISGIKDIINSNFDADMKPGIEFNDDPKKLPKNHPNVKLAENIMPDLYKELSTNSKMDSSKNTNIYENNHSILCSKTKFEAFSALTIQSALMSCINNFSNNYFDLYLEISIKAFFNDDKNSLIVIDFEIDDPLKPVLVYYPTENAHVNIRREIFGNHCLFSDHNFFGKSYLSDMLSDLFEDESHFKVRLNLDNGMSNCRLKGDKILDSAGKKGRSNKRVEENLFGALQDKKLDKKYHSFQRKNESLSDNGLIKPSFHKNNANRFDTSIRIANMPLIAKQQHIIAPNISQHTVLCVDRCIRALSVLLKDQSLNSFVRFNNDPLKIFKLKNKTYLYGPKNTLSGEFIDLNYGVTGYISITTLGFLKRCDKICSNTNQSSYRLLPAKYRFEREKRYSREDAQKDAVKNVSQVVNGDKDVIQISKSLDHMSRQQTTDPKDYSDNHSASKHYTLDTPLEPESTKAPCTVPESGTLRVPVPCSKPDSISGLNNKLNGQPKLLFKNDAHSAFNRLCISCPTFESEDSHFVASRKTPYEEILFRVEDELYSNDLIRARFELLAITLEKYLLTTKEGEDNVEDLGVSDLSHPKTKTDCIDKLQNESNTECLEHDPVDSSQTVEGHSDNIPSNQTKIDSHLSAPFSKCSGTQLSNNVQLQSDEITTSQHINLYPPQLQDYSYLSEINQDVLLETLKEIYQSKAPKIKNNLKNKNTAKIVLQRVYKSIINTKVSKKSQRKQQAKAFYKAIDHKAIFNKNQDKKELSTKKHHYKITIEDYSILNDSIEIVTEYLKRNSDQHSIRTYKEIVHVLMPKNISKIYDTKNAYRINHAINVSQTHHNANLNFGENTNLNHSQVTIKNDTKLRKNKDITANNLSLSRDKNDLANDLTDNQPSDTLIKNSASNQSSEITTENPILHHFIDPSVLYDYQNPHFDHDAVESRAVTANFAAVVRYTLIIYERLYEIKQILNQTKDPNMGSLRNKIQQILEKISFDKGSQEKCSLKIGSKKGHVFSVSQPNHSDPLFSQFGSVRSFITPFKNPQPFWGQPGYISSRVSDNSQKNTTQNMQTNEDLSEDILNTSVVTHPAVMLKYLNKKELYKRKSINKYNKLKQEIISNKNYEEKITILTKAKGTKINNIEKVLQKINRQLEINQTNIYNKITKFKIHPIIMKIMNSEEKVFIISKQNNQITIKDDSGEIENKCVKCNIIENKSTNQFLVRDTKFGTTNQSKNAVVDQNYTSNPDHSNIKSDDRIKAPVKKSADAQSVDKVKVTDSRDQFDTTKNTQPISQLNTDTNTIYKPISTQAIDEQLRSDVENYLQEKARNIMHCQTCPQITAFIKKYIKKNKQKLKLNEMEENNSIWCINRNSLEMRYVLNKNDCYLRKSKKRNFIDQSQ